MASAWLASTGAVHLTYGGSAALTKEYLT